MIKMISEAVWFAHSSAVHPRELYTRRLFQLKKQKTKNTSTFPVGASVVLWDR